MHPSGVRRRSEGWRQDMEDQQVFASTGAYPGAEHHVTTHPLIEAAIADRADFERLMALAPDSEQEERMRRTAEAVQAAASKRRAQATEAEPDEFGFVDAGGGTKVR